MFNCQGCWDAPCTCGEGYRHFTATQLRDLITFLATLLVNRTVEPTTQAIDCKLLSRRALSALRRQRISTDQQLASVTERPSNWKNVGMTTETELTRYLLSKGLTPRFGTM